MTRIRQKIKWTGPSTTSSLMTMNEFIEYERMVEMDDAKWDLQGERNDNEHKI